MEIVMEQCDDRTAKTTTETIHVSGLCGKIIKVDVEFTFNPIERQGFTYPKQWSIEVNGNKSFVYRSAEDDMWCVITNSAGICNIKSEQQAIESAVERIKTVISKDIERAMNIFSIYKIPY